MVVRLNKRTFLCLSIILLTACTAHAVPDSVVVTAPGFLLGFWQGIIAPIAFVVHFFNSNVAVYAVPNNGWPYNLGFLLGLLFLWIRKVPGRRRSG
jgi:hypothetical protein